MPWHPGVFVVSLDSLITAMALLGLKRLWQKRSVFATWLAVALVFLFLWPTKWPQYVLIMTVPLSLAAAEGFQAVVWEPLIGWLRRLRVERLLLGLPGIERRGGPDALRVERRVAGRFVLELLSLLGFRKLRRDGEAFILSRRRFDLRAPGRIEPL